MATFPCAVSADNAIFQALQIEDPLTDYCEFCGSEPKADDSDFCDEHCRVEHARWEFFAKKREDEDDFRLACLTAEAKLGAIAGADLEPLTELVEHVRDCELPSIVDKATGVKITVTLEDLARLASEYGTILDGESA